MNQNMALSLKRTEVSELNATMYGNGTYKGRLKLTWLKRDEENKTNLCAV